MRYHVAAVDEAAVDEAATCGAALTLVVVAGPG